MRISVRSVLGESALRMRVLAQSARIKYYRFRYSRARFGKGTRASGRLIIEGPGRVIIGDHTLFLAEWGTPTRIRTYGVNALVTIGDHCLLNGANIHCREAITIGANCCMADARIMDLDFHGLEIDKRFADVKDLPARPVNIADNVLLGTACIILKGVSIGSRSVVGAGTVVARDVPPDTIVVGAPPRQIPAADRLAPTHDADTIRSPMTGT